MEWSTVSIVFQVQLDLDTNRHTRWLEGHLTSAKHWHPDSTWLTPPEPSPGLHCPPVPTIYAYSRPTPQNCHRKMGQGMGRGAPASEQPFHFILLRSLLIQVRCFTSLRHLLPTLVPVPVLREAASSASPWQGELSLQSNMSWRWRWSKRKKKRAEFVSWISTPPTVVYVKSFRAPNNIEGFTAHFR